MCTVSIYENIQLELCLRIYMYIQTDLCLHICMHIIYIQYIHTYIHYIHMVAQDLRASTNSFWSVLESSKHFWKLQYIREICIYYNCFPPKDDENQLSKSLAILKNVPTVFLDFHSKLQLPSSSPSSSSSSNHYHAYEVVTLTCTGL